MSTSKNVILKCGVCGNSSFEYDDKWGSIDDADEVKCTICNKVYTQEELREVNTVLIDNEIQELADAEIRKALKKSGFKIK